MKILFLIRSLERGGAERQLALLARGLRQQGHDVAVAVFYGGGIFEAGLAESGVALHDLGKKSRWDIFGFLSRISRLVREYRPDVLHGYMPVANILASLVVPRRSSVRLVWGVRASDMAMDRYDWLSRLSYVVERWLARRPSVIIANSEAARVLYVKHGIAAERIAVVPNGIDTDTFRPDLSARESSRTALGFSSDTPVVGLVARLDPMKDHETFLAAAHRVHDAHPAVRFVCVGGGADGEAERLKRLAAGLGIAEAVSWLGARDDLQRLYPAFDLAVSSSAFGEGFSNTIGEAMACGLPCVATDVGDAGRIVGDTGTVVPVRDPQALAAAIGDILAIPPAERSQLGEKARRRVTEEFGTAALVSRTVAVLTGRPRHP